MSLHALRACAIALLCAAGLAACNTIEGAGEDMQAGGRAVENSAESNKP